MGYLSWIVAFLLNSVVILKSNPCFCSSVFPWMNLYLTRINQVTSLLLITYDVKQRKLNECLSVIKNVTVLMRLSMSGVRMSMEFSIMEGLILSQTRWKLFSKLIEWIRDLGNFYYLIVKIWIFCNFKEKVYFYPPKAPI